MARPRGGAENTALSDTTTITVYVNDINEAPAIGEATREMATFAERISARVDHATALSTEATTAVAALRNTLPRRAAQKPLSAGLDAAMSREEDARVN